MINFSCDYLEGAHPRILERMTQTNLEQTPGYGEDAVCDGARERIRELCGRADAAVHFLVGGTQCNLTVIAAALRPHQGVLCADTGHINIHETGAIEATGHKVLPLESPEGKINAAQVEAYCERHYSDSTHEHMVQPGMVYISHPSEVGTLYSKAELAALREVCTARGLLLYLDGARLAYGLTSPKTDVTLRDIAALCDVFYIGGTKCGAFLGEAAVILDKTLQRDFRYIIKQRGGMFAKGRLLGLQFQCLFEDDLYYTLGRQANALAARIREACETKGYNMLVPSYTNQQFPILPDRVLSALGEAFTYSYWQRVDETHSAVRFCTSWATTKEQVDELTEAILST